VRYIYLPTGTKIKGRRTNSVSSVTPRPNVVRKSRTIWVVEKLFDGEEREIEALEVEEEPHLTLIERR
jgi:hypothetical protein